MNAFTKMKPLPSLWGVKTPGLAELSALINLFPEAAFLVNVLQKQIVAANPILAKLTAFPPNQLNGAPLSRLIAEPDQVAITHGEKKLVNVLRSKRSPLAVEMEVQALDPAKNWLAVILIPSHRQIQANWADRFIGGVRILAQVFKFDSLGGYLEKAVDTVQNILDAGMVCIYQARSDEPGLLKVSWREALFSFPVVIPSTDLIRLQEGTIWFPGKRVLTEIHRTGRLGELNYVASVPIGGNGAFEGLLVVADNEKQPIELLMNLMQVFGAQIGQAIQYFILVENLKKDLVAKRDQLAVFQAIHENAQNGIIILDKNLNIVDLNPAIEWMLGYSRKEVLSQTVDNIIVGNKHLDLALESAREGISAHNINEPRMHQRSGQTFPAIFQVIPVREEGNLVAILVFVTDISENEQNRALAQHLEQRAVLGDVSAVFAHEVRNPINNISLSLQLLSAHLEGNDSNQEAINQMLAECTRIDHLMESILSFSRPLEPRFESVDIARFTRVLVDRWRPRFARVNIEPFFFAEEDLPQVTGDPRAFDQVFTNLISNAVEVMRDTGGSLSVNVRANHTVPNLTQVEVTVSDDGPGIPDEIRERIFEPFVSNNKRGTGLGLAITKRIVTAHKGGISVSSVPGATIFTVLLPGIESTSA